MPRKVILVADPGIDTAFAIAVALFDPELDVVGLAATPGNVDADQATRNVQILVEQLDPPRFPRLGAAPNVEYEVDGTNLHGSGGLGNGKFPCARLHHQHASDKLIADLVRQYPKEITIIVMGPCTVLATALDRDPELPTLVQQFIVVGGAWHEPGNATAAAEFHFFCDPLSARQVLHSGTPTVLVPLDVTRKLLFSPSDLLELPAPESRVCKFLSQIVAHGIRASSNIYGIEGFHLMDVLGLMPLVAHDALAYRPMQVDVEVKGEITRGMSVFDTRPDRKKEPNIELVIDFETPPVREYIHRVLAET
ncbi:MAG: nucleoside hydrolase [Gemmataceae bacterium]